jgi:hypothetical protein
MMNASIQGLLYLSSLPKINAFKNAIDQYFWFLSIISLAVFLKWFSFDTLFPILLFIWVVVLSYQLNQKHAYIHISIILMLYLKSNHFLLLTDFILVTMLVFLMDALYHFGIKVINFKIKQVPDKVNESIHLSLLIIILSIIVLFPIPFGSSFLESAFLDLISRMDTAIIMIALNSLNTYLWYKGYHGSNLLSTFVLPISYLALLYNLQAYDLGHTLPYLLSGILFTHYGNYVIFNALQAYHVLTFKEDRFAWLSSFFNINESLIFSTLTHQKENLKLMLFLNALNMSVIYYFFNQGMIHGFMFAVPFIVPSILSVSIASASLSSLLLWLSLFILDLIIIFIGIKSKKINIQYNNA